MASCKSNVEIYKQKHFLACLKRQTYKCSDCKEIFSLKEDLISHMESVHGKKRQYFDYKCPDCDMSFPMYNSLTRHIKMGIHAGSSGSRSSYELVDDIISDKNDVDKSDIKSVNSNTAESDQAHGVNLVGNI